MPVAPLLSTHAGETRGRLLRIACQVAPIPPGVGEGLGRGCRGGACVPSPGGDGGVERRLVLSPETWPVSGDNAACPERMRHIPGRCNIRRDVATYRGILRHIHGRCLISRDSAAYPAVLRQIPGYAPYPGRMRRIRRLCGVARDDASYLATLRHSPGKREAPTRPSPTSQEYSIPLDPELPESGRASRSGRTLLRPARRSGLPKP